MRLNEATRSHVRGQSSPNLNLYILPLLALFHARDSHAGGCEGIPFEIRGKHVELNFTRERLKIRMRRILFLTFCFFLIKEDERIRGFLKSFLEKRREEIRTRWKRVIIQGRFDSFVIFYEK